MPDEIYELVAQGARYWFLFLMALIAWRSWRWYRRDRRQAKKRLKLLPDAGFVGEMVVLQGGKGLERGAVLPVPCEGTLGAARTNDLCVQIAGVEKRHLWFRYDEGRGLMVEPFGKNAVNVDGADFESRRDPLYMGHGSRLYVGEAELRLRMFAGFEAEGTAQRRSGVEDEPAQQQPPQPDAQQMAAYQQWMQQQWMMQQYAQQQAYQQGYQQAMAQQQPQQTELYEEPVSEDETDVYTYEEARAQGLVDDRAFMRPAGEKKPELPVYEQPLAEPAPQFYPPEMDAGWADEEYAWDEENGDEGMNGDEVPDAAEPPRSAYVGHDEAERAKRRVWDRYLGGGAR